MCGVEANFQNQQNVYMFTLLNLEFPKTAIILAVQIEKLCVLS